MSEVKVLHEWTEGNESYTSTIRLVEQDGKVYSEYKAGPRWGPRWVSSANISGLSEVARLAARVRELEEDENRLNAIIAIQDVKIAELEAAVRWVKKKTYSLFDQDDGAFKCTRADFAVDMWELAHPIVREVVEKGEG